MLLLVKDTNKSHQQPLIHASYVIEMNTDSVFKDRFGNRGIDEILKLYNISPEFYQYMKYSNHNYIFSSYPINFIDNIPHSIIEREHINYELFVASKLINLFKRAYSIN